MNAGERFGMLVTVAEQGSNSVGLKQWLCRCDCGKDSIALATRLTRGRTKSCGCRRGNPGVSRSFTGQRNPYVGSRTYVSWFAMLQRCGNPKNKRYSDYGGRGITVCDQWKKFANFLADMGIRPDGMTLDRIDVDGNYEPSNCRWADGITQARNKRSSRIRPEKTTTQGV